MSARARLILDLDTGIDDALALAYVLGSPEVELAAVVTSYGNVTVDTATRNTLALLRLLGHPEVPVYRGASRALAAEGPFAPSAEVVRSLSRATFMGGALAVPGNVTPCAEANVHNDPEAADRVLRSGLATRMIGLDVTHQVVLTREHTARWRSLGTPAGRLFADMTDHYIGIYERNNPHLGGCALHDPLAAAAALDPTLVGCLPANLRVDIEGATRGRTVCDPERLRDAHKDCEDALTVDAPRFLEEFLARVERVLS